jgi:hypothetical protein
VLRQVVGDLEPGGFARYVEVKFRAYTRVIIETAESNAEFRNPVRAVYDRRTADAAKPAMKSWRRFKVFYDISPVYKLEIFDANAGSAAEGSAMGLPAIRTMTMTAAHQRSGYFIFDTAA